MGAEIEGFGRGGVVTRVTNASPGAVQLLELVLQPLPKLGRHRLQGLLGLGDCPGINTPEASTDLHTEGIGRANDLGRIAHD